MEECVVQPGEMERFPDGVYVDDTLCLNSELRPIVRMLLEGDEGSARERFYTVVSKFTAAAALGHSFYTKYSAREIFVHSGSREVKDGFVLHAAKVAWINLSRPGNRSEVYKNTHVRIADIVPADILKGMESPYDTEKRLYGPGARFHPYYGRLYK